MDSRLSEFRVPIVVTLLGLVIVAMLARTGNTVNDEQNEMATQHAEALAAIENSLEEIKAGSEQRLLDMELQIAAMRDQIETLNSQLGNQTAINNKALGRTTTRIANQAKSIENLSKQFEDQTTLVNKAMGRTSKRIAAQSDSTEALQLSVNKLVADSSKLTNHTSILDKAVSNQLDRHNTFKKSLAYQRVEIHRLKKINDKLSEIFNSLQ